MRDETSRHKHAATLTQIREVCS